MGEPELLSIYYLKMISTCPANLLSNYCPGYTISFPGPSSIDSWNTFISLNAFRLYKCAHTCHSEAIYYTVCVCSVQLHGVRGGKVWHQQEGGLRRARHTETVRQHMNEAAD